MIYIYCFCLFVTNFLKNRKLESTKNAVQVFCILHIIHFIFLSLSVFLNNLPIIPINILGGFLAYLFIIVYPFIINKIVNPIYHTIFFYYVGFIMAMTYLSRVKGEFTGAEPELFHFIALIGLIFIFIFFGLLILKKRVVKTKL